MELSFAHLLEGAVLAGFIATIGLILNQKSALVRIETLLTGANGDNGLVGDVKALRKRSHDHGDSLNVVSGKVELVTLRLDTLERRVGPEDRRHA